MNMLPKWFKKSIARTLLLAFILISVVPIVVISFLYTRQSTEALTAQMEANLQLLAQEKAEKINVKLFEVLHTTEIAAGQAAFVLGQPMDETAVSQSFARYQPDSRNILGLDNYYQAQGGADTLGEALSNVYWNNETAVNDNIARQIVQTEQLDKMFGSIKAVSPDTQWIYMTTDEGMMRLYPWASNDHYPDGWDPRQIIFYTVAEPDINPDMETRWTPPYVDFAGAGWMVTVSTPIINEAGFQGIMSHDITIASLQEVALSIQVLDDQGYGFLIDENSKVIAHPEFQDADASQGAQEDTLLLETGSFNYRQLIANMVDGETGLGYYAEADEENLLVYAPIEATGWSLGIIVPKAQVIAPALEMQSRVMTITVALIVTAVLMAILFTRLIHRPLVQLLQGVNQVSDSRRADEIEVDTFSEINHLAAAFNDMATKVWEREEHLKNKVARMSIEIDAQRRHKQLDAIVETDFFKRLEMNAQRLKEDIKGLSLNKEA